LPHRHLMQSPLRSMQLRLCTDRQLRFSNQNSRGENQFPDFSSQLPPSSRLNCISLRHGLKLIRPMVSHVIAGPTSTHSESRAIVLSFYPLLGSTLAWHLPIYLEMSPR
jgi:hypothetical protein